MIDSQCLDRVVQLVLPPSDRHVRTARLVAADLASRAGLDCDETDDLRIAVDEVCHALIRLGQGPLSFSFVADPVAGVCVTASAEARAAEPASLASQRAGSAERDDVTGFAAAVLGWVADTFEMTEHDGRLRFFVSKRHGDAEGAECRR
ncbi:MAG: ATP-binding protein [Actinobacteria bacterium]|nr:ATP-binding protein [Actinomycetota bacterium]